MTMEFLNKCLVVAGIDDSVPELYDDLDGQGIGFSVDRWGNEWEVSSHRGETRFLILKE